RLCRWIEFRAEIVDDHQQREAGEPGGIGSPLEPGELIRHAGGSDEILHHMVEATAVDLPGITLDPRRQTRTRLETEIAMDEIKRTADPSDASDDVQPPHDEARPFGEHRNHDGKVPLNPWPAFLFGRMTDAC